MEKLILGDCLEEMKSIPDSSIDMIMADLPYGTTSCRWDTIIPFEPLWEQYKRVIKKNGAIVLTASQPFTSALVMSNIEMFKYCWVWEKSMPSGMATSSFMPMKYHEDICVFVKEGKPTFNKQLSERSDAGKVRAKSPIQGNTGKLNHVLMNRCEPKLYSQETVNPKSIIKIGSVANSTGRLHPTQKPVALMEYLIKTYTNEGDTVLDNVAGSFTTGVACVNTKRHFIGIEKEREYYDIGVKRIAEAKSRIANTFAEGR